LKGKKKGERKKAYAGWEVAYFYERRKKKKR